MSKKFLLAVSVSSFVFLSACVASNNNANLSSSNTIENAQGMTAESSENILAAEGNWDLVEEESYTNPLELHSKARKSVNPSNKAKKQFIPQSQLANVAGTKGEEDVRFRLLRMQRNMKGIQDDLIVNNPDIVIASAESEIFDDVAVPEKKPEPRVLEIFNTSDLGQTTTKPDTFEAEPENVVSSLAKVNSIRFGEHPGKTRMVLDLTGKSAFNTNILNQDQILLVELPSADWGIEQQKAISQHPLVAGYTTKQSQEGGTMLALKLKRPVKIIGSAALPPSNNRGHRIYLDLAAS